MTSSRATTNTIGREVDLDAFLTETVRLRDLVSWNQPTRSVHHPPPRNVMRAAAEERADRARSSGVAGLESDLSVRDDIAASERPQHREDVAFERGRPDYQA
jgi:hypothetical protein